VRFFTKIIAAGRFVLSSHPGKGYSFLRSDVIE